MGTLIRLVSDTVPGSTVVWRDRNQKMSCQHYLVLKVFLGRNLRTFHFVFHDLFDISRVSVTFLEGWEDRSGPDESPVVVCETRDGTRSRKRRGGKGLDPPTLCLVRGVMRTSVVPVPPRLLSELSVLCGWRSLVHSCKLEALRGEGGGASAPVRRKKWLQTQRLECGSTPREQFPRRRGRESSQGGRLE